MSDTENPTPTADDVAPAETNVGDGPEAFHTAPHEPLASAQDHAATTGALPSSVGLASSAASVPYLGAYAHPGAPTHQPATARAGVARPQIAAAHNVQLASLGAPDTAESAKSFIADSTDAGAGAAGKLITGIDAVLAGNPAGVEALEGDQIPAAQVLIESLVAPSVGNFVKSIFGLGGPITNPYETNLSPGLVVGLHILRAALDGLKL